MSAIRKACDDVGSIESDTGFCGRWMLPDGEYLNDTDGQDHRAVGYYCENSWLEFIVEGACSLHYEARSNFLAIRTTGLTNRQRMAYQSFFEHGGQVDELNVIMSNDSLTRWDEYHFHDGEGIAIELFLTDTIAFRCEFDLDDYLQVPG